MRPRAFLAATLAALAAPALAQTPDAGDPSALIGSEGLRGAEARLAALPAPTPSDRFALGGVRFLGGLERALQLRYRVGLSGGMAAASGLPVLRLPIPENPAPEPFEPAMIAELFAGLEADMAGALDALEPIGDGDEVAVAIDMADLWFDIDADGARGPGEDFATVVGVQLDPALAMEAASIGAPAAPAPVIRFDTADAAWLAAYAHLLSGLSEAVLALDPEEAVARVLDSRAVFAALGGGAADPLGFGAPVGDWADLAAILILAVEGQPDPARTRAARDELLAAVRESRRFWTLVAREPDDDREWIPNKRQVSATGLPFPPETGPVWLGVLADMERVLTGEALIPFWRVGEGAGLDLAALLENPPELDVAGLIQGAALLPYLREGPRVDGQDVAMFGALFGGRAPLYAVVLN